MIYWVAAAERLNELRNEMIEMMMRMVGCGVVLMVVERLPYLGKRRSVVCF